MKTKRAVIVAVVAIFALLVGFYLWGPSSVPAGQEPLIALSGTNFSEFEAAFDADANVAHVILLLSPT
ncbi:MAG TPA: hypothetical protein VEI49_06020 [Terriglobales bacterium]|nr:hypothetical protein [Terriglobales bacterium]